MELAYSVQFGVPGNAFAADHASFARHFLSSYLNSGKLGVQKVNNDIDILTSILIEWNYDNLIECLLGLEETPELIKCSEGRRD